MDNILFYRPLWEEPALKFDVRDAIDNLRKKSVNFLLHKLPVDVKPPPITAVITASIHIIEALLRDHDNVILQKIRDHATEVNSDPNLVVRGAIVLWYESVYPLLSRQGLSDKRHIANLGYLSMLLVQHDWKKPTHPKLHVATLITDAVISILHATFVITPHLNQKWRQLLLHSRSRGEDELTVFVKTYWQVSREGENDRPGAVFGAKESEARISPNGKKLLVSINKHWHEAPFWHPFRTVPGSPWNKFIKNKKQKVFPVLPPKSNRVRYMVPGSATRLITSCETFYGVLRRQFDRTETPRVELSHAQRIEQFKRLAEGTGRKYPDTRPVVENAIIHDYSGDEHLYNLPTTRKNAADRAGNLTLPFLTDVARAWRFTEEPEAVDEDFHAMIFLQ